MADKDNNPQVEDFERGEHWGITLDDAIEENRARLQAERDFEVPEVISVDFTDDEARFVQKALAEVEEEQPQPHPWVKGDSALAWRLILRIGNELAG